MKTKFIKTIGVYIMAGAATAAGATLWNDVIRDKIEYGLYKHKCRKNKVIKFKKL